MFKRQNFYTFQLGRGMRVENVQFRCSPRVTEKFFRNLKDSDLLYQIHFSRAIKLHNLKQKALEF